MSGERINELVEKFVGYAVDINEARIRKWLRQFRPEHNEIALKLLEGVDYYTHARTVRELRTLGDIIRSVTNDNLSDVYFAGFTEVGKSGDWIIHDVRLAMRMTSGTYQGKFIHLSSLSEVLEIVVEEEAELPSRSFVFMDDYVGTGESVIKTWARIQGETNDNDKFYIAALVGTESGIRKIQEETELEVICNRRIPESLKVFHVDNILFTQQEKEILLGYCRIASPTYPTGYKDTQSLTVFYQRISDNVISVLNCKNSNWEPLFPRYL